MMVRKYIQKVILSAAFILLVQAVSASLTSSSSSSSSKKSVTSKYTLKNLRKYSNKSLSLNSVKYNLKIKSTEIATSQSGTNGIQFSNGNTTFIYPYKIKVKVPKFKTPTPSGF